MLSTRIRCSLSHQTIATARTINKTKNQITYFSDIAVLVNDWDGSSAKSCIKLTKDGKRGYLEFDLSGAWAIDFENVRLAPHRWYIHHGRLAAYEQPCYKGAQEYIRLEGRLIYLTFPFLPEDLLHIEIDRYLSLRRKQLDEIYFIT